jgi:3-hydroxybutyryl-CoA dehydratase
MYMKNLPSTTLGGLYFGQIAEASYTVTNGMIDSFSAISGDYNSLHLDDAYACRTMYRERIAPGMLTANFISAVLGTKLPGQGCVCLTLNLNFMIPVRIGDTVTGKVIVTAIDPILRQVVLKTEAFASAPRYGTEEVQVAGGEALVYMPTLA